MEAKDRLTFTDKLIDAIQEKKSILNVGLDPQLKFMPPYLIKWAYKKYGGGSKGIAYLFKRFNQEIIDAVSPFAVSVKPQIAFYECYGHWGIRAFEQTIEYAHKKGLLVITDAKRGDGGDTAQAYASAHLGKVPMVNRDSTGEFHQFQSEPPLFTDALTIHAWIGSSCVNPFLEAVKMYGTGIFVVVKTSFKPNSEIEQIIALDSNPVWVKLAMMIAEWAKGTEGKYGYQNFGVVLGATYPDDAPKMRKILPKAWFLIPGYGAQGGGADGAVFGINKDGYGGIVNSSRGVIAAWSRDQFRTESEKFAEAAAKAAEFARDDLNKALKRAGKYNW